jgi:hypothetical protein
MERVAVLGASKKSDRYSYKALLMLKEHGHNVIPVHLVLEEIEGIPVKARLKDINEPVDTLTIYVGPGRIKDIIPDIIELNPKRVILNPGTESEELINELKNNKINYIEACTLVLLSTGQF